MHKIRLCGVVHGAENEFNLPTNIHPSVGLTANLYGLPEKSRVGIEYFQGLYSGGKLHNIDYNGIKICEQTIQYWQEVLDYLHDLKHIPVFLDDLETYKKYLLKAKELGISANIPLKAIFDKNMNERVYRSIVERENIFVVERERKMLERIAKEKPEAVLIGAGHADYLYLTPSLCSKYGIHIKSYSREKLPEMDLLSAVMRLEAEGALDVQMYFEQNPTVSSFVWSERGFLERNFSAVTKGRIIPDNKPKYIGTWDTKCPPRGLFEIYPRYNKKKGDLIGTIEDTIGTADFAGRITDDEVDFVKTYYAGAISVGGAEAPIRFTGSGGNGFFRGACGIVNGKEFKFELREFNL